MKYDPSMPDSVHNRPGPYDEQWIGALMRTYYNNMFAYGTKFTRDEELIKDCIQEIFISLWQRRNTVTDIVYPKFYFLRAIKNKILKALDSAARKNYGNMLTEEYDFVYELSIEKIIISRETLAQNHARLKSILANLSKREKEVIYLKYFQELDNAHIAALMNISAQSVYNLLYAAILKLRTCWQSEFAGAQ